MALYLITGGCGFIGSNLAHALVARGERVRILDNLSSGREVNIRPLLQSAGAGPGGQFEFVRGDIVDWETLTRAMTGVDYVLHQAAVASVPKSVDQPLETDRINAFGTLQVLEAARQKGSVKRVTFAASSAAYGDREPDAAKTESMPPAPLSPYAVTKLTGEHYCAVYSQIYGLPAVALRYFNIFGPRQDPTSQYAAVIPNFVQAYLRGQPATIFGDGLQSRDFCHVDNVVEANLLACHAPAGEVAGKVFNIACGEATTLLGVIDVLGEIFGGRIAPVHKDPRAGDVRQSLADISLAQRVLHYTAGVKFAEGLARTVAWYRS